MKTKEVSRRQVLSSVGATVGMSLLAGCSQAGLGAQGGEKAGSPEHPAQPTAKPEGAAAGSWQYAKLDADAIAAEVYRLVPQGGCMYGIFAGILAAMARLQGEPYASFPVHMMKYGEGGVGLWGSLCGTVNGGAAIIGLFVPEKEQRQSLIAELFSWYEATELPTFRPKETADAPAFPKSVAGSVLCHVSAGKWCKAAGAEIGSDLMKERCRRLTAEVAQKTVELLNANLRESCTFAGPSHEVTSCLACHGKAELHDTIGQMRCSACHQQLSEKHPSLKTVSAEKEKGSGSSKQGP
jgi:hypothetical protein